MDDTLTLQLASGVEDIDAEAFLDVFRNTLEALRAINREVSEHGTSNVAWRIVDTGLNSPIHATITGVTATSQDGDYGPPVIAAFVRGVAQLEKSKDCPQKFNEDALRHTERLLRSATRGVTLIEFRSGSQTCRATRKVSENAIHARRVLEQKRVKDSGTYIEYGSIEGYLKGLEEQSRSDKIIIKDALTGQEIPCYFKGADIDLRKGWKNRVIASGDITVDRLTGEYTRMDVDAIEIMADRSQLPQMSDLDGIDITGGVESSTYIRGLRDGE